MKLFNTLSKQNEELKPQNPPGVTVYTCGPTVYDYAHIGHWFTYVRSDTLIRTLKLAGYTPKWVMNITDVGHLVSDGDDGEDKLEKGARREGKSAWQVAEFFTKDFLNGLTDLNITQPDYIVKATDHISEQIDLVQELLDKGFGYVIDDGVYFDTSKFKNYADFARLDLDEQQAGARVNTNPQKRGPQDFALWKFSPEDKQRDMEWDNPFSQGRKGFPGWHVECSAMSMKYLGPTLDIHTGGIDHVPVHHTNEIAQSQSVTGQTFANYWMHSNHVTVEGEKISKSLGNGIRYQEVISRGISTNALRLHILESHYRSQSKFSWESLGASQSRLQRWQAAADQRWQVRISDQPELENQTAQTALTNFRQSMLNDLDTPQALLAVESFFSQVEQNGVSSALAAPLGELLELIRAVLGIDLFKSDIDEPQKQLIANRQTARQARDWAKSDNLRDELAQQGVGLNDFAASKTIWYRLP